MTAPVASTQPVVQRAASVLTRADVVARAGAWAATLQRRSERDCAVYTHDGFEFICILLGAWQAGKTVWLPGDTQAATCAKLHRQLTLFIGDFIADDVLTAPDKTSEFSFAALAPEQLALQVFTSGSTGEPSAIPKTLRQLDAEVAALHEQWGAVVGQTRVIASVPHQHFYGLLFKVLWPLCRGAVFESHSVDYPEQVCASLAQTETVWIGSPALLRRLPSALGWVPQHLRAVFCSGGPLPLAAAQQCREQLGQWPREVYGSSETGAVAGRTQDVTPASWRALPGVRVQREPTTGQLDVRGPWVATQADDANWLMADRGEVQADGSFSLLGRADRIVKVAEKRVSLDAMERALSALPEVLEVRLLQFPEGRLGAVLVLTAVGEQRVQTQGRAACIEYLRNRLSDVVERVALPRRWRLVAELPRNAMGKITDAALQALFDVGAVRPRLPVLRAESRAAEQVDLDLFIPPDLIYFDGHFSDAPILPGVAQLDWAVTFARRWFNISEPFQSMAQIKFQQVIQPAMSVHLRLIHLPAKSAADFQYTSAAGAHSSGRLVFGA